MMWGPCSRNTFLVMLPWFFPLFFFLIKTQRFHWLNNYTYTSKFWLQHAWHIKTEIGPKCHQAVEEEHQKTERPWKYHIKASASDGHVFCINRLPINAKYVYFFFHSMQLFAITNFLYYNVGKNHQVSSWYSSSIIQNSITFYSIVHLFVNPLVYNRTANENTTQEVMFCNITH